MGKLFRIPCHSSGLTRGSFDDFEYLKYKHYICN